MFIGACEAVGGYSQIFPVDAASSEKLSFQDVPDALRPDSLKEATPLGIPRLVDGMMHG